MKFPERFVLMDTEFTAWEGPTRGWDQPGKYKEIIQIGCVACDANLSETGSLSIYVRPEKNPILSEYIKNLTGITQDHVDAGSTLAQAVAQLSAFCGGASMYSWGTDGDVILDNCTLIGVDASIPRSQFIDLSVTVWPILESQGIDPEKYSSGSLITAFGKEGAPAHDAVNDMRNLLVVLQELRSRGVL